MPFIRPPFRIRPPDILGTIDRAAGWGWQHPAAIAHAMRTASMTGLGFDPWGFTHPLARLQQSAALERANQQAFHAWRQANPHAPIAAFLNRRGTNQPMPYAENEPVEPMRLP
jgi:hypothetical protein